MFDFNIDNFSFNSVHFIGIGGVSMSGLASILLNSGYSISGSDANVSSVTKDLENRGVTFFNSHSEKNILSPDLVIYTDAISSDNPELIAAKERNIMTIDRGTFLGQLMKKYEKSIAVAGTHGKTSTTGILSALLADNEIDPTIMIGGYLDQIKGNLKIGDDKLLITEACEYKGNILKFHPSIGIILNIDADHLDYYKGISEIIDTFKGFATKIPDNGSLIINGDDENCRSILKNLNCNLITFGIKNYSDFQAKDIVFDSDGFTKYNLVINDDKVYSVKLSVLGLHNVYNSLAALASGYACGIDIEYLIEKIVTFKGADRRLQFKGSYNGAQVIDDYAHHPTEIKVTLSAIKSLNPKKIFCIFQPHTYTRTISLLDDFSLSFFDADKVIITNIYAAREKDTGLVHSKHLVDKLLERKVDAMFIEDFKSIEKYIKDNAKSGDLIITMGAGDVYKIGENII